MAVAESPQRQQQEHQPSDLLFAWLSPIETKVDRRLHPKSPSLNLPASSPLVTKARSALRKTVRVSHGNSFKKSSKKSKVKEASDACLWLKAAGFPQYVQMFEDGYFPINLSKFQVEKDHSFLDQAGINSLIRRLNILNRCADMMEDIRKRCGDSEDESNCRALSNNWQFRRKQKKWSRRKEGKKASHQETLFSSTEDLLDDNEEGTPTSHSPPMLVSELRKSLTGLDRAVKTYSFMMSDDQVPIIQVDTAPSHKSNETNLLEVSSNFSSFDSEDDGDWDLEVCPSGDMDNFATGIISTFESNLLKMKETQSLPDIFKVSKSFSDTSPETSPLSSASASTASILGSGDLLDPSHESPNGDSRVVYPASPLTVSASSPDDNDTIADSEIIFTASAERRDTITYEMRNRRVDSTVNHTTCDLRSSMMGSECSERDLISPQPPMVERPSVVPLSNGVGAGNGAMNGGDASSFADVYNSEGFSKRISRISTTSSSKMDETRRHEIKWHSYQRPHSFRQIFKPVRTLIPIEELSVGQISVLRKLSLIKLTALIELYKSKSNISRILKGKKQKVPDTRSKRIFGVPLSLNLRRTGQVLPSSILCAFKHLQQDNRLETLGLFRRAASKARVEMLRETVEVNSGFSDFHDFSSYDIADLIKLYYRELPEPILTSKLSEMLIMIQENVPSQVRLPAFQAVMLLMPDENREALQVLLLFLKEVAKLSDTNQMTAQNLAVCFAPSLFCMSHPIQKTSSLIRKGSFKRNTLNLGGGMSPTQLACNKEVTDSVAASHCLNQMICHADKLFKVAADMLQVCRFTHLETGDPVPYYELGLDRSGLGNLNVYVDNCIYTILRESRKKFKNWVHYDTIGEVEVSYLKPRDGVPLWVWRGVVEVEACSTAVHRRLWMDKILWDRKMSATKVVTKINDQTEIFQYLTPSVPPLTERDHCLLRSWQYDIATQSYILVATSVSHPSASLQGGIRAMQLATFYLVEPLEGERSRVSYICRVDMRGRSADYYNNAYGPYLASTVSRIKDSLTKHNILETTV